MMVVLENNLAKLKVDLQIMRTKAEEERNSESETES